MVRAFLLITVLSLFSGCALTKLYDENKIILQDEDSQIHIGQWASGTGIFVFIDCDESIYSIMVSPIIPLPPIIPVMGLGDSNTGIRVIAEKNKTLKVKNLHISNLDKKPSIRKINSFDNQSNYTISYRCEELSGKKLHISITEPELIDMSFDLGKTESKLKLFFGYLGE